MYLVMTSAAQLRPWQICKNFIHFAHQSVAAFSELERVQAQRRQSDGLSGRFEGAGAALPHMLLIICRKYKLSLSRE